MNYFLLIGSLVGVGASVDQCRTREGNTGDCILLDKCTPLKEMNSRNPPKMHEIEYLRKASCGQHIFKPKVCCPRDWSIFATSTTPKVPESTSATTISATSETSMAPQTSDEAPFKVRKPVYTPNYSSMCPPSATPPQPDSQCCGLEVATGERITGGHNTGIDQYPWLAIIVYEDPNTQCAGSLISSRYVLTAAHCLDERRLGNISYIRLAEYNRTSSPKDCIETSGGGTDCVTATDIRVEKIIVHPNYFAGDRSKLNDLGLVRLSWNAPYTDFIRPICLPVGDVTTNPDRYLRFFVAGWGWDGTKFSEVKQQTSVRYVPLKECQNSYGVGNSRYSLELWLKQICAGGEDLRDACRGDSGGPLMHEIGGTFFVAGVVSIGPQRCGTVGKPGIYTHVYPYLDWIKSEATL